MFRLLIIISIIVNISLFSFCDYLKVDDFTGGINTRTAPDKLKDNEAVDITNLEFGIKGSLSVRNGIDINVNLNRISMPQYFELGISKNDYIILYALGDGSYIDDYYEESYFQSSYSINGYHSILDMTKLINSMPYKAKKAEIVFDVAYGNAFNYPSVGLYMVTGKRTIQTSKSDDFISGDVFINVDTTVTCDFIKPDNYQAFVSSVTGDMTRLINTMLDNMNNFAIFKPLTTVPAVARSLNKIYVTIEYDYSQPRVVTFSTQIINIDDKDSDLYIQNNYVLYKDKVLTSNVEHYVNSLKNIYLFGDNQTFQYNNYINDYCGIGYQQPNNIGYGVYNVSGNLIGTYNYGVTYVYDGTMESNPFVGQSLTTSQSMVSNTTSNISDGKWFFQIGDKRYSLINKNGDISIIKTNTGNVFLASRFLLSSTYPIFKAQYGMGSIYFSLQDGNIYRIDLTDLSIPDAYYNKYGPFFSISSQNIFIAGDISRPSGGGWGEQIYGGLVYYGGGGGQYWIYYIFTSKLDKYFQFIEAYHNELESYIQDGGTGYIGYQLYDISSSGEYPCSYFKYKNGKYVGLSTQSPVWTDKKLTNELIDMMTGENWRGQSSATTNYEFTSDQGRLLRYADTPTFINTSFNYYVSFISDDTNHTAQGYNGDGSTWLIVSLDYHTVLLTGNYYVSSQNFSVANQQIQVVIPTSNSPRVTSRVLYRQRNGSGFYYLTTIADNITTLFIDNIPDIQQSSAPLDYDNNVPPNALDACYTHARMFYLDSSGTVWYSKINKPESVPPLNYIQINKNDSDKPIRILDMYDGLFVFFEKSIYYIDLSSASTLLWIPRRLNVDYGCPYPNSITKGKFLDNRVAMFYMAQDKSIRALDGVGKENIQLFDNIYTNYFSEGIQNELESITDTPKDIYATYYDYSLYVSVPSLKTVYVWDSHLNGWTKFVYPLAFKYLGVLNQSLVASDYNSPIIYTLSGTSEDDLGTPISWNYKSKIYPSNSFLMKNYDKLYFRGKQYTDGKIKIDLYSNYDTFTRTETITTNMSSSANITTKQWPLIKTKGRDFQFQLSGTQNIRIDGITTKFAVTED